MNLYFDESLAARYASKSQQARVMSESWLAANLYCPGCGHRPLGRFANGKPVADFFCSQCKEQFELKSKAGVTVGANVPDGAYQTMLARIRSDENPSFFFLAYRKTDYFVRQLVLVPRHFITTEMIVPRAKGIPGRPGYIMCAMNMAALPEDGKILMIDQGCPAERKAVLRQWRKNLFLRGHKAAARGWLLAVMRCIEKLPDAFTLAQVYSFEAELRKSFPANSHIKEKIRQQLQILRDQHLIEFMGGGNYRKAH